MKKADAEAAKKNLEKQYRTWLIQHVTEQESITGEDAIKLGLEALKAKGIEITEATAIQFFNKAKSRAGLLKKSATDPDAWDLKPVEQETPAPPIKKNWPVKSLLKWVIDPKNPGNAQIVHLPISLLKFLEKNPNKMTPQDLADLRNSLQEFSAVDPAVINLFPGREFIIVGGNHRIEGATELGWTTFPCVFVYLDPEQEMKLVLRLKKNQGKFDDDILRELPLEMLEESGFHETDLEALFGKEPGPKGGGAGGAVEVERQDIRPYNKTHVLLSFSPDVLVFIRPHLEQILKIAGVEYEQSSN